MRYNKLSENETAMKSHHINPLFPQAATLVKQLQDPSFFLKGGTTIHQGRNTLKLFTVGNKKFVVKSFDCTNKFRNYIYGIFCKSKARRAYDNAIKLYEEGINTPQAVAYINIRHKGALRRSYFISTYAEEFCSMRQIFQQHPSGRGFELLIDAMTRFIIRIHETGFIHNDLNVGNILYRRDSSGYPEFMIVDTNRGRFYRWLSFNERISDLCRLDTDFAILLRVANCYADIFGEDCNRTQLKLLLQTTLHKEKQKTKHNLKKLITQ